MARAPVQVKVLLAGLSRELVKVLAWRLVLLSAGSAALRRRRLEVPAMAVGGRRPAKLTASRNITSVPSMTQPKRRPAASVRRHRRNIRPSVKDGDPAAHFSQTGPAGKHPYSPAHNGPPAMSHRLTDRQQKNPLPAVLPPPDSPVSMDRRAAALRAAPPAEAEALQRKPLTVLVSAAVVAAVSPRTPQEEEASAVNPVAVDLQGPHLAEAVALRKKPLVAVVLAAASPRRAAVHWKAPLSGAAASAAVPVGVVSAAQVRKQIHLAAAVHSGEGPAAQPGIPVLEVHPPGPHRKRKCLRPAQQEQGRPRLQASLESPYQVLSPVQQE